MSTTIGGATGGSGMAPMNNMAGSAATNAAAGSAAPATASFGSATGATGATGGAASPFGSATSAAAGTAAPTDASSIAGTDTFLKLLVAQMRNQDPRIASRKNVTRAGLLPHEISYRSGRITAVSGRRGRPCVRTQTPLSLTA